MRKRQLILLWRSKMRLGSKTPILRWLKIPKFTPLASKILRGCHGCRQRSTWTNGCFPPSKIRLFTTAFLSTMRCRWKTWKWESMASAKCPKVMFRCMTSKMRTFFTRTHGRLITVWILIKWLKWIIPLWPKQGMCGIYRSFFSHRIIPLRRKKWFLKSPIGWTLISRNTILKVIKLPKKLSKIPKAASGLFSLLNKLKATNRRKKPPILS